MVQWFMGLGLLTRKEREAGLQLVHNYDALMEATTKERYEAAAKAVGGPWMSRNEQRAQEGLEPVPGGDEIYPPSNMTREAGDGAGKEESEK